MSLPEDFLTQLEQYEELSQRERDVFLEMFGHGKSRVQVAQYLNISESALSTCLTGIYKKFRISGSGPIKENRLQEYLTNRYLQPKNSSFSTRDDLDCDIDTLVQEIREKIKPNIREQCGKMRVLDMRQPIGLGEIYTNVNVLEKRTRTSERERHISGLEAIEKFSKLMILGKPGAGKTTFLKHLAIQCISGEFQAERVPVFVTLKDFAKTDENPVASLENVMREGRALILLDGLDEVRDADSDWVLQQIQGLLKFSQNRFVITCRITSREDTFDQFTKVEIADFDDEQIAYFYSKWFNPIDAKNFQQELEENERIRELAKNPLLLTLLCLVFRDSGSFPTNRASLYQQCVEQLLRKWNPLERECDPIYKKLSPDYREELISEIAWKTFERGNFNHREVKEQIREYIRSLPGISSQDLLNLDSKAVLESIEAQHGLLEEQTMEGYSFSHLTFHEYFTANKIVTSIKANGCFPLEALVTHITESHWREVFLLTVQMLDNADTNALLQLMKTRIDRLLAGDEKLQKFLMQVNEKVRLASTPMLYQENSNNFQISYRAFYIVRSFDIDLTEESAFWSVQRLYFGSVINRAKGLKNENHTLDLISQLKDDNTVRNLSSALSRIYKSTYDPVEALDIARLLDFQLTCKLLDLLKPLKDDLEKLKKEDSYKKETMKSWWNTNGKKWTKRLREVTASYHNIGHEWQFSDTQKQLLQQYYDANKLLVNCLNSDCYVSQEVRQEIEDTLLLPMSEIEKRQQGKVG